MQLETRDPGASLQATGAMVSGAYKSTIANQTSKVNKTAQGMDPGMKFDRHGTSESGSWIHYAVNILRSKGIDVDATSLDMSGELARADEIGRSGKKGCAYIVHSDDPVSLWWMNHRTGEVGTWCSNENLDKEGNALLRQRIEKQKIEREKETARRHEEAAQRAQALYKVATEETEGHGYSVAKRLRFDQRIRRGEHMGHDCLIVPIYDKTAKLTSVQFIAPGKVFGGERDKTLLPGGKKAGCFCPIGPSFRGASRVVIGEGLSSVQPVVDVTGLPGVVAIDKGNLLAVAEAVRELAAPDADIIILADDDMPDPDGLEKAKEAAAAIGGRVALPAMGKKADMWDVWAELGTDAVKERVEMAGMCDAQADEPEVYGGDWPEPMELNASNEQDPYPLEDLPPVVRNVIDEVVREVMCPVPLAASSALGAMSLAIQGQYDVQRTPGLRGPSSLYFLTKATSGERKSECERLVMAGLRAYEEEKKQELAQEVKDYRANQAAWEATKEALLDNIKKTARKNEDKSSYEEQLRVHINNEPTPPMVPSLFFEEPSTQQLIYALGKKWPSAGIFSDEAGVVFGGHAMQSSNAMQTFATWNKLWSGDSLSNERRGESYGAKNCRLSMHLMTQEETLREFISNSKGLVRGTGLMARYLLSSPASTMGTRFIDPLTVGKPRQMPHLEKFTKRIRDIVSKPLNMAQDGGISPQVVPLSASALGIWCDFYNHIERELKSDGEFADVKDVASKVAENAARLACLFYIMSDPQGGALLIDDSSMQAGLIVAAWHLAETKRFLSASDIPQDRSLAMALDTWIMQHCAENHICEVPRSTVLQYGPNCIRSKTLLDKAIVELSELGRIRESSNGKRKSLEVNPAIIGGRV